MIEMLRKRREDGEEGFTLIELMVVVLIIGILLAIAVPTFLSAQKNAKNKAATSNVRQAISAAKTVYADKQTYAITLSDLQSAEPGLKWVTTSTGPNEVAWAAVGTTGFGMAALSKNDICFQAFDSTVTGTTYGQTAVASGGSCTAPGAALTGTDATSTDAWK